MKITDALILDWQTETERITGFLREKVSKEFKKRGVVVAISGGVDSSTTLALCVKAFGAKHVFGLLMPEKHSAEDTLDLSEQVAKHFGVDTIHQDITLALEGYGCYAKQEAAVKRIVPEFDKHWKFKIVLPSVVDSGNLRVFSIVAQSPNGNIIKKRLPTREYLEIVAATNFKQRVRKTFEYYHADRLNYAVVGTPNRLEYDQGFFVKLGDGNADIKPIAHLYKTQVYGLGRFLGVPEIVLSRPPSTDTYSMAQGQDEFYFSLPYDRMDLCLYGLNQQLPASDVAKEAGLSEEQLQHVYQDIMQKRRSTRYLHMSNLVVESVV